MNDVITEIKKSGCSEYNAAMCAQLYFELIDVKKYYDVTFAYHSIIEKACCFGRKYKASELLCFVPIPFSEGLSFESLQQYAYLCDEEIKKVYLAICSTDSTCVFYEISNGIGEPPSMKKKRSIDKLRNKRDKVLEKNIPALNEAAMLNVPLNMYQIKENYKDDQQPCCSKSLD